GRGGGFRALGSKQIEFNMQPIALVLAESFEQARYAARLVKATYAEEKPLTDILTVIDKTSGGNPGRGARPRGNPQEAFAAAPVKIEAEYTIPIEHHNPMEPHAAIAYWEGDKLTIFDKTQGVYGVRGHLASVFQIPAENIDVISPFVGGAFGSSLSPHYYVALTATAAKIIQRPVKVVYTRSQMFTGHGYRSHTWQKVSLAAERDGRLTAFIHDSKNNSSAFQDRTENATGLPRNLYACPNAQSSEQAIRTNMSTPSPMRAPGAVSGMFAVECAMDELAYALKIDPLELRLINFTAVHPDSGLPFSSKALKECYQLGAEKFGWKNRNYEPGSMKDGRMLVGWGMASGLWSANQLPATVHLSLKADGTGRVASATSDIGPGTYTVMTLLASEYLGLEADKVKSELGDSRLPQAPVQGGSFTTASVGTAIYEAAQIIRQKLLDLASKEDSSPLKNAKIEDTELMEGKLRLKDGSTPGIDIFALMRLNNVPELSETHTSRPSSERSKYATGAHGAQFVEVKIDPDIGTIQVTRVIEVTACGKIMNPKTSHSQEIGGMVWGIGMALQEATEVD
ncbi:xanthine dehydrogenase family protein molybdopterin-binding subunit, partial [bacterium]